MTTHYSHHGVLFLCLGNICRSPLAEGAFIEALKNEDSDDARFLKAQKDEGSFLVDSAGTSGWHKGSPPDPRSIETAQKHGVDISQQRSRPLKSHDFDEFTWIVAMDRQNLEDALAMKPKGSRAKVVLFTDFIPLPRPGFVPDPYYGGPNGFDHVWTLLERGMPHLLSAIKKDMSP